MKKILSLILVAVTLVVAAGIYRFNFTNDDIYVAQAEGLVVPFSESNNNVMLAAFGLRTDKHWQIQLPDSEVKATLSEPREYDGVHLATGKYQDEEERGLISLDYGRITALGLGVSDNEIVFAAPFSVSNQGSGIFWYLGLFKLNTDAAEIEQLDTFFLGDRVKIKAMKSDETSDIAASLYIAYLERGETQGMAEVPSEIVEQRIKISMDGFEL